MKTSYWALADQHGTLLPEGRHGTTSVDAPFPTGERPRLYLTKVGADRALNYWLRGHLYYKIGSVSAYDGDYSPHFGVDVIPGRADQGVHVVKVLLELANKGVDE